MPDQQKKPLTHVVVDPQTKRRRRVTAKEAAAIQKQEANARADQIEKERKARQEAGAQAATTSPRAADQEGGEQ